jgi:hypothetical protein
MVPFFIPGVGAIAGPASMAALGGAEAYTKTGSVASGLTAGALNLAMPGIANVAEQAVLKRIGGKLLEGPIVNAENATAQAFKRYYAQSLPQGVVAYAGGQAAAAGTAVASDVAQQVLSGEDVHISPTEQLLNLTLGQLPFAAMHLTKGGRVPFGGSATRNEIAKVEQSIAHSKTYLQNKQLQEALDETRTKSTISDVPDYGGDIKEPTAVDVAQKNFLINKLRQQQRDTQTEGTPLSLDEWHKDNDEVNRIVRETGLQEGNILGAQVDDKTERFPLIAKEVLHRPETGWRMVIAADDPRNGEYAGKKVDWSTLHEPDAQPSDVEGNLTYMVPKGYHDTKPPSPGWIDRQTRQVEGLPELPLQPNEVVDANSEIRQAEDLARNAKNDTDFQAAILKVNSVRNAYGWKPLDDVEMEARRQVWELGSQKDAFRNALEETRRQVQARDASRNESELNRQRIEAQKELDVGIDAADATAQSIAQKKIDEIDSQMVDLSPMAQRKREQATFAQTIEDAKGKDAKASVAKGVVDLYNTFSRSGKARYNEIATGGMFEKKLHEWKQEGTGDIEQLKVKFAQAIASGAGLKGRVQKAGEEMLPPEPELAPQAEKAINVEKKAETIPVKQSIFDNALKVTEVPPETLAAWPEEAQANYAKDREMFLDLVSEGKNYLQAKYKLSMDAFNAWKSQNHVTDWMLDLSEIAESNMAPNSVNRPRKRTLEWKPITATEKDFAAKVGTSGNSVVQRLLASAHPDVQALAKDLSKYTDALQRIVVKIADTAMGPHATWLPDRNVRITLNSDMAKSSSSAQDMDLMHELMHGLSQT